MIAEPPRERYALIPVVLIGVALLLVALRGSAGRGAGPCSAWWSGSGVALLASGAALAGKDYVVERNLLPALVPLVVAAAVGFAADGARRIGLPAPPCSAPTGSPSTSTSPDAQPAAPRLPRPRRAARPAAPAAGDRHLETRRRPDPLLSRRPRAAHLPRRAPVREIDVVSKPIVAGGRRGCRRLPPGRTRRLERLTLIRYVSTASDSSFHVLRDARTGFGATPSSPTALERPRRLSGRGGAR